MWSAECKVRSAECKVRSLECKVWSVERTMYEKKFGFLLQRFLLVVQEREYIRVRGFHLVVIVSRGRSHPQRYPMFAELRAHLQICENSDAVKKTCKGHEKTVKTS